MGSPLQLRVPPLVVTLLFAVAMWLSSLLGFADFAVRGQGWLAGVLLTLGLGVAVSGVATFRRTRTTVDPLHPDRAAQLVTGGVYRLTRNPMYLGMALLLFAWGVLLGSIPSFLFVPLFMVYMTRFQVVPEEEALLRKFGGAYTRYREHVRRWL